MEIKLKKLVLENFMCYALKEIDFSDFTKISAMNGMGKSTIANAYMWLFFNCDYELRDNQTVRREVDGKTIDDVDVSVTAVIDMDGKEITAKKVQKRTYSKDGASCKDDNKYFINDVPKTLKDFNSYFELDMNVWKMCTSVNAFLSQKPADMRSYLFSLVSEVTDVQVASSNKELKELVPLLEKYKAEELLAMNKATKSKVTKELPILDGQIMEKERDIQIKSDIDVSDLELLRNSLKDQIKANTEKQTNADRMMEECSKVQDEIMKLKFDLSGLQNKANEKLISSSAEIRKTIADVMNVKRATETYISEAKRQIATCKDNVDILNRKRNYCAEEWKSVNSEQFNEDTTICPTCGRKLATSKITSLRNDFESKKKNRLDDITSKGMDCKSQIDKNNDRIKELEVELDKLQIQLDEADQRFEELNKKADSQPTFVDISDTEEHKAIQDKIAEKEEYANKLSSSDIRAELKAQENDLRQQLAECEGEIAKSDTTADEERLSELKKKKLDMEQSKTDCEKILDLLDELEKTKNELLTDQINSHFFLVQWKLFDNAKNGNYKSVCIPMVDGKSILTTMSNKGNRILGRIDICKSIQKISGINCPIWLDDTENLDTVNQSRVADMVDSQLIMLLVNDNKELKVEV
nr:MAG TPA: chromosome partition protein [Bacteriophage sp.]